MQLEKSILSVCSVFANVTYSASYSYEGVMQNFPQMGLRVGCWDFSPGVIIKATPFSHVYAGLARDEPTWWYFLTFLTCNKGKPCSKLYDFSTFRSIPSDTFGSSVNVPNHRRSPPTRSRNRSVVLRYVDQVPISRTAPTWIGVSFISLCLIHLPRQCITKQSSKIGPISCTTLAMYFFRLLLFLFVPNLIVLRNTVC